MKNHFKIGYAKKFWDGRFNFDLYIKICEVKLEQSQNIELN